MARDKKKKWLIRFEQKYKTVGYFEKNKIEKRCVIEFYVFAVLAALLSLVWIWIMILLAQLTYTMITGSCGDGEGSCGWIWLIVIQEMMFLIIPYALVLIGLRRVSMKLQGINKLKKPLTVVRRILFGYAKVVMIYCVVCFLFSVIFFYISTNFHN